MIDVIVAVLAGLGLGNVWSRSEADYQAKGRKLWRAVASAAFVFTLMYGP